MVRPSRADSMIDWQHFFAPLIAATKEDLTKFSEAELMQ
jgi:hypothetical protein